MNKYESIPTAVKVWNWINSIDYEFYWKLFISPPQQMAKLSQGEYQIFILMVNTSASGLQYSTPSNMCLKKQYRNIHILTGRLVMNLLI